MKKKTLSLALALAMCLGLTVPAFAAESDFTIENGVLTVYTGAGGDVVIPDGVTSIGEIVFVGLENLTSVTIPDGVTDIGSNTFRLCTNLARVTIPSSVISIEIGAFGDCTGLKDVYYGGSEAQWKAVTVDDENDALKTATIHYNGGIDTPTQPQQPDAPAYQVSNWAKDRVALAVETGLAPEGLGNDYRVNITRAQFAATAVKLYEAMSGKTLDPVTDNPFTDTTDPVILQAADMGFVSGVGGGRFDPEALVNREQAAVMLSSVYTKLGGSVPTVAATTFADNGDVSGWAKSAVAFMNGKEIVTGVGNNNFSPKGNASIEQALLISLKMFETLK